MGAYYAYTAFCKEKGIKPHDIKDYESISFLGFLGSLYDSGNRSPELAANPDNVIAYYPKGTRKMTAVDGNGKATEMDIINDVRLRGVIDSDGVYPGLVFEHEKTTPINWKSKLYGDTALTDIKCIG